MIREKGTNKTWEEFYELYDKIADKLYKCAEKQFVNKTSENSLEHCCTWIWDIDECTIVINDIKKDGRVVGIELTMTKNSFKEWIGSIQYYDDDFADELHYGVAGEGCSESAEDAEKKLNSLLGRYLQNIRQDYGVAGEEAKEKLNSLYGRDSMYRKKSDYSFQQMYPIDYKEE